MVLRYKGMEFELKTHLFKHIKLCPNTLESYFVENGFCISFKENSFYVSPATFKVRVGMEYRLVKRLIKQHKYKTALLRGMAHIAIKLKRKEIWVFMDRANKADDNAEVLYRYCLNKDDNIKCYFIISEDSTDFERMQQYGKVIPYGGFKQKLIILLADKLISSHIRIRNPFDIDDDDKNLKSLLHFKYVFLQHGIIKNDITSWLNRFSKNLDLFITSAVPEYKSILEYNYYYNDKIVKLTGLPRYDKLKNNDQKQILIMPTWRSSIVEPLDGKEERAYNPMFKTTEYFARYNKLVNDSDLQEVCSKMGYKIIFFIHPNMRQQMEDFDKSDTVIFEEYSKSYSTMFCESSLLITDYSSVAFDFAYLKKPILYYQFDYKKVLNWKEAGEKKAHHCSKGYFDYETMGFGQVCYRHNKLIESIINTIEDDCNMEDVYKQRVDDFFAYTDTNNCERVYNAIREMDIK